MFYVCLSRCTYPLTAALIGDPSPRNHRPSAPNPTKSKHHLRGSLVDNRDIVFPNTTRAQAHPRWRKSHTIMDDESQLQRRIELSSPEDLAYLIANVRDAATARLNEALPPDGEDEDAFRIEVEALVNDVQLFSLP